MVRNEGPVPRPGSPEVRNDGVGTSVAHRVVLVTVGTVAGTGREGRRLHQRPGRREVGRSSG